MERLFSVRGWLAVNASALALSLTRPSSPILGFVLDAAFVLVVVAGWFVVCVRFGADMDEEGRP